MSSVLNTKRRFGQADHYHFAMVDGEACLFTDHELKRGKARAKANAEDLPVLTDSPTPKDYPFVFVMGFLLGALSVVFTFKLFA
jgi:hypothetical protein